MITPRARALADAVKRAEEHLVKCAARYERLRSPQSRIDHHNADREVASLKNALKLELAKASLRAF
jgi:hypothetical protein